MDRVPAIDLSPLQADDASAIAALGRQVDVACRSIGFLTVTGHRVDPGLIAAVRREAFAFFDLAAEEKAALRPPPGVLLRGYTPPETNTLARSKGVETPPDFREMFSMGSPAITGREYAAFPDARMFYTPNIWPAGRPALREVFTAYFIEMERLAGEIMQAFAIGLGLDRRFFSPLIDRHFSAFHALHYAPQTKPPAPGQLRAGAHSDFGSLTILMPPAEGGMGLQVLSPTGGWIAVEPEKGAYVINIGDLMQQWTNDRWVSTVHRVINPEGDGGWAERRLSLGFFCHPNYDAAVACLPTCTDDAHPAKYPPVLAGDYMRQKIKAVRHLSERVA
jgi:isopenicillin N synthase-like dioxygenase